MTGPIHGKPFGPCKRARHITRLANSAQQSTLRILDLEERLAALEGQLEGLLQHQSNPSSTDSAELLTATEERIARLEDLLNEPIVPRGSSVHPLQRPQPEAADKHAGFSEPALELNPFPEDEEQPCMDELSG